MTCKRIEIPKCAHKNRTVIVIIIIIIIIINIIIIIIIITLALNQNLADKEIEQEHFSYSH